MRPSAIGQWRSVGSHATSPIDLEQTKAGARDRFGRGKLVLGLARPWIRFVFALNFVPIDAIKAGSARQAIKLFNCFALVCVSTEQASAAS